MQSDRSQRIPPLALVALLALAAASLPAHAQPGHGPISGGGGGGLPGANEVTESMLKVVNACTDEYVLTCETTAGDFEWQAQVPFDSPTFTTKITTPSVVGGTSGTSTLTLDGDSTVPGDISISSNGALLIMPSGAQVMTSDGPLVLRAYSDLYLLSDGATYRWAVRGALTGGNAYRTGALEPWYDNLLTIGSKSYRPTNVYSIARTLESDNSAEWISGQVSELVTIAAAATTDTTMDLPADSVIRSVVTRATVAIPTATAYTVGDPTTAARFATGCAVTLDATCVGTLQSDQTGAAGPRQPTAAKVRITPNGTPADATGRVRVTVFYDRFVAPAS